MLTHMKTEYARSLGWKAGVEGSTTLKPNDQDADYPHPWRQLQDSRAVPFVSRMLPKPNEGFAGPGKERSPAQPGQIVESEALRPASRTVTAQTTEDLIARLRDDNRIPIADIARACDVSRQTIYDWLSGQQASDAPLKCLRELARMAERLIDAGDRDSALDIPIAKALRRPITGGLSLLDAIARNDNPDASLEHLLAILRREAAEHQRLVARLSRGRRRATGRLPDDPIGDIGAPAYDETDVP